MKPDRVPNAPTGNRPDRDDRSDLAGGGRITVDEALKHRLRVALHHNQDTTPRRPQPPAPAAVAGPPARPEPAVRRCGRAAKAKRCFPTEAAARARLAQVHGISHSGRGYGPIRVHHCRKCRQWHLTSKTNKPQGRGKRRR